MDNELLERRISDLKKATNHERPEYIPVLANIEPGIIGYSGHTLAESFYDPEAYTANMGAFFDRLYCDASIIPMVTATPCAVETFGHAQFRIGPDGCTLSHMAEPMMEGNEYGELLADYDGFIEKLLRRKYPDFFNLDLKTAMRKVKAVVDENGYIFTVLEDVVANMLKERSIASMFSNYCPNPGIDAVFDTLRGFKGTVLDLRRHYDELKAASEMLWEIRSKPMLSFPPESGFPYYQQVPHIPTYLKPKQFDELYWPQMKEAIETITGYGSKVGIVLEGSWMNFLDHFREVPKDSTILMADDDDVIEISKRIGDWQTVAGGAKLNMLKSASAQECKDYAKRAIDECGRDGGFIFTVDKPILSPVDCCGNLFEVYQFAHEYGKC